MSWLKRLIRGRTEQQNGAGDYAGGDWSPVPVSAAAQNCNVVGWLQEREPQPHLHASVPIDDITCPRRTTLKRLQMMWKDCPEEEEQQAVEKKILAQQVVAISTTKGQQSAPPTMEKTKSKEQQMGDVLKIYGEHLTEEELQIIRKQLK